MNADRLLAHYERIADAPDAIVRLRRFVLDLAVRGRLVPQNASEEPTSELLKQIAKEKARLVKAGSLRRPRELDDGGTLKEPFPIPTDWRWVRLDAIGAIVGGGTPSAADLDNFAKAGEGLPWLTPADLGGYSAIYVSRGSRDLSAKGARTSSATMMPKGTVLFTSRAPIGYVAIAANPIFTNQGFKSIVPYVEKCSRYTSVVMLAFAPEINARAPGTTFKEVSGKIVAAIAFPLPPLGEQHRIVAKVDELMALCDRLEAALASREAVRDRLAGASLARLAAPDPETFQTNTRFTVDALPALTARPDQIKAVRQTILNLATKGHLSADWRVENPGHGEAALIVRGLEEAHLQNGGHRRGNAAFATDGAHDLIPEKLPQSWGLTELKSAVHPDRPITYGILMPGPDTPGGVPYVRVADFPNDRLNLLNIKRTSYEIEQKYARARLTTNDILLSIRGSVGRTCLVPKDLSGANITQDTARLSLQASLDRDFILLVLRAPDTQSRMQRCSKGVAVRGINIGDVRAIQLPIPPLAEQHRIVAKVDALMSLCDRLEAALTAADSARARLLDALLAEALGGAEAPLLAAAE